MQLATNSRTQGGLNSPPTVTYDDLAKYLSVLMFTPKHVMRMICSEITSTLHGECDESDAKHLAELAGHWSVDGRYYSAVWGDPVRCATRAGAGRRRQKNSQGNVGLCDEPEDH